MSGAAERPLPRNSVSSPIAPAIRPPAVAATGNGRPAPIGQALGTIVDTTVFRKLKELSYRSSYSHRGRYYTLAEIPQFDPQGLWSFQTVWFSRWGNLLTTLEVLVHGAPQGYFAHELQQVLHVESA